MVLQAIYRTFWKVGKLQQNSILGSNMAATPGPPGPNVAAMFCPGPNMTGKFCPNKIWMGPFLP